MQENYTMKMVNQFLTTMEERSTTINYLLAFLGGICVSYILAIRLVITRLPKDLPQINNTVMAFIYGVIPLCFFVMAIYPYVNVTSAKHKNFFSQAILGFYSKSLKALNDIITKYMPSKYLGKNLLNFTKYYTAYLRTKRSFLFLYCVFNLMPKILF